jgi:hypothetical protein
MRRFSVRIEVGAELRVPIRWKRWNPRPSTVVVSSGLGLGRCETRTLLMYKPAFPLHSFLLPGCELFDVRIFDVGKLVLTEEFEPKPGTNRDTVSIQINMVPGACQNRLGNGRNAYIYASPCSAVCSPRCSTFPRMGRCSLTFT